MKRSRFLFNQIIDFENIRLAWLKAKRGKTFSYAVIAFNKDVNGNLEKIRQRLMSQNPDWGNYRQFYITDPKKRLISAASFEERIMHHAIMNVLEPVFERQMIYHTYACRKEKGTHKAIYYAFHLCKKYKYVLKLDIRKYFDSINHQILKEKLNRIIKDSRCLFLFDGIIDSYEISDCSKIGLPIGNLTSQFFANLYLSSLDHYILEKLHAKAYCRYMDDMLLFGNSKSDLINIICFVKAFCIVNLRLELKEPVLVKTSRGVPFLGYSVGSCGVRLLRSKQRQKKKKIKNLEYLCSINYISEDIAAQRMNAVCNIIEVK